MRQFIAMIAAAIAAFSQKTWQMVKRGGRWVLEMVTPSGPAMVPTAMPMMPEPDNTVSNAPDETIQSLRKIMRAYLVGEQPDPETLQGLPAITRDWVRCLDQRQLQILASAGDDQVRAHLQGTQPIRSVPRHDAETAAELLRVCDMDKSAKMAELEAMVARRQQEAPQPTM